jgi:hypothetical protein
MSFPESASPNPYQPPQMERPTFVPAAATNLRLIKVLKDFRTQIVALGAVWIIMALLAVGIGVMAGSVLDQDESTAQILLIVLGVSGLIWGTLGVFTCLKQMWAVYVGLVLSYLSVIGNLLNFNLCALIIVVVVIIQAHRVIGFARELARAGIPLDTKPQDLQVKFQLPGT